MSPGLHFRVSHSNFKKLHCFEYLFYELCLNKDTVVVVVMVWWLVFYIQTESAIKVTNIFFFFIYHSFK